MKLRRRMLLVAGLLTVVACTPNVPYRFKGYEDEPDLERYRNRKDIRPSRQSCWVGVQDGELVHQGPPCEEPRPPREAGGAALGAGWRYHLSVIEFDDLGDFWLRAQLEREFQCLLFAVAAEEPAWLTDWRKEFCAGDTVAPAPDGKGKRSAIVTLFIHGWKHNASPKNESTGNLASFHDVLRRMAQGELARAGRCIQAGGKGGCEARPREVIGVYIGWRGKSFARIPLLQEFTIFNRRAAAERVARVAVSHTIHRVVNWTKESNRESRAILVGHSLGGVILENVLTRTATVERDWSDALEERPASQGGGTATRQPLPVDLAFLINPANEAILAEQTIDVLGPPTPRVVAKSRENGHQVEVPIIVSIASPGDKAVRFYFPISQRLKAFFGLRKFKPGQRFLFTHTPGFSGDDLLLSHEFSSEDASGQNTTSLHSITPPPTVTVRKGPCVQPDSVQGAGRRKEIHRERLEQLDRSLETVAALPEGAAVSDVDCIESISYHQAARVKSRDYTKPDAEQDSARDATDSEPKVWTIRRRTDTLNISPYWVMSVNTDIIGTHTDIFNPRVIALISAMVSLKQGIFDDPPSRAAGTDG